MSTNAPITAAVFYLRARAMRASKNIEEFNSLYQHEEYRRMDAKFALLRPKYLLNLENIPKDYKL